MDEPDPQNPPRRPALLTRCPALLIGAAALLMVGAVAAFVLLTDDADPLPSPQPHGQHGVPGPSPIAPKPALPVDRAPPELQISSPRDGAFLRRDDGRLSVTLSTMDPGGVTRLELELQGDVHRFEPWVVGPHLQWRTEIPVPEGLLTLRARAYDRAGHRTTRDIHILAADHWAPPPPLVFTVEAGPELFEPTLITTAARAVLGPAPFAPTLPWSLGSIVGHRVQISRLRHGPITASALPRAGALMAVAQIPDLFAHLPIRGLFAGMGRVGATQVVGNASIGVALKAGGLTFTLQDAEARLEGLDLGLPGPIASLADAIAQSLKGELDRALRKGLRAALPRLESMSAESLPLYGAVPMLNIPWRAELSDLELGLWGARTDWTATLETPLTDEWPVLAGMGVQGVAIPRPGLHLSVPRSTISVALRALWPALQRGIALPEAAIPGLHAPSLTLAMPPFLTPGPEPGRWRVQLAGLSFHAKENLLRFERDVDVAFSVEIDLDLFTDGGALWLAIDPDSSTVRAAHHLRVAALLKSLAASGPWRLAGPISVAGLAVRWTHADLTPNGLSITLELTANPPTR